MSLATIDLEKRIEILEQITPFDTLNRDQLQRVAASLLEETYQEGIYIGRQGETSRHVLFLVVKGKVEISVKDKYDNETVTGYREPLEFMGETVFFSGEEYPASARAVEETQCLLLPNEVFEEVLVENPDFAAFFSRMLAERLRVLYQKISDDEDSAGDEGFNKRIGDVMITNVVTCSPTDDVQQIASLMHDYNVSSVIVTEEKKPVGIITEGDLVSKVLSNSDLQNRAKATAKELMSSGLISVHPNDLTYQAFLLMVKNRITHVVATDDDGNLAGIVAMQDVIKSRKTGALAIVNRIEASATITELVEVRREVDQVLRALLVERATAMEATSVITELYDRITRKVIQISEQAMVDEGHGPPPASYCWITMGSSGRKEQYARTDQDNGIIYENVPEEREEEVKKYFLTLGEKVVAGLERYGFERCKGNVMANNEDWTHSFGGWRNAIKEWITFLEPQNVRYMTIFLDFRFVYGKKSLYDLLLNFVVRNFRNSLTVLNFLVEDNLGKRVPLSIFRQIQTERSGPYKGMLNLKTSACVHMVDCVRVFALREGLLATNTVERLKEIGKRGLLKEKDVEYFISAYETLMMLRIKDAMEKMRKGIVPDNYINPRDLSNREYALLREALIMVSRLQTITNTNFRIAP